MSRLPTKVVLLLGALGLVTLFASSAVAQRGSGPDRATRQSAKAAHAQVNRQLLRDAQRRDAGDVAPSTLPGAVDVMDDHQHGGSEGHLLPTRKNVQRVSKFSPTGKFGDIVEGQIADLAVFKGFAYLNSWNEPTCTRGGTYVVDINRPDRPKDAGFIPALPGNYQR
jgi:hypothetical protein